MGNFCVQNRFKWAVWLFTGKGQYSHKTRGEGNGSCCFVFTTLVFITINIHCDQPATLYDRNNASSQWSL